MNLQYTHFEDENVRTAAMGGGVIPVALDDNGIVHALLGRERFSQFWKGSSRWSGFEGARKPGETIEQTAAREFAEESLEVVYRRKQTERLIINETFPLKIVLRITTDRDQPRYHNTYVTRVPWLPDLPETFGNVRGTMEHIDRLQQELAYRKTQLFDELDVGPITRDAAGNVKVIRDAALCPCILRAPWTSESTHVLSATFAHDDAKAAEVWEWHLLREKLARALGAHPHAALVVRRDDTFGCVQHAAVLKDYMEKDRIAWWSFSSLHRVMAGKGTDGCERFRPYFLPVLQALLNEEEHLKEDLLSFAKPTSGNAKEPSAPASPTERAPQ